MRTLRQVEALGDWIIDRDLARATEAEESETTDMPDDDAKGECHDS